MLLHRNIQGFLPHTLTLRQEVEAPWAKTSDEVATFQKENKLILALSKWKSLASQTLPPAGETETL